MLHIHLCTYAGWVITSHQTNDCRSCKWCHKLRLLRIMVLSSPLLKCGRLFFASRSINKKQSSRYLSSSTRTNAKSGNYLSSSSRNNGNFVRYIYQTAREIIPNCYVIYRADLGFVICRTGVDVHLILHLETRLWHVSVYTNCV